MLLQNTQNTIDELTRDALIGYNLEHVIKTNNELKETVTDDEALYEHLLLDVKVSKEVTTTPLLEATGSVQLYINQTINGVEPAKFPGDEYGATDAIRKATLKEDWAVYQDYRVWEANEKLEILPSLYLEPELRQKKNEGFKALEQLLNSGELNDEHVITAINGYLNHFSTMASLTIKSCYYDPKTKKGLLLGAEAVSDKHNDYYIQRFSITDKETFQWESWEKIKLASSIEAYAISIMMLDDFPCLFYFAKGEKIKNNEKDSEEFLYPIALKHSAMDLNGDWSPEKHILDMHFIKDDKTLDTTLKYIDENSFIYPGLFIDSSEQQEIYIRLELDSEQPNREKEIYKKTYILDYPFFNQIPLPDNINIEFKDIVSLPNDFSKSFKEGRAKAVIKPYTRHKWRHASIYSQDNPMNSGTILDECDFEEDPKTEDIDGITYPLYGGVNLYSHTHKNPSLVVDNKLADFKVSVDFLIKPFTENVPFNDVLLALHFTPQQPYFQSGVAIQVYPSGDNFAFFIVDTKHIEAVYIFERSFDRSKSTAFNLQLEHKSGILYFSLDDETFPYPFDSDDPSNHIYQPSLRVNEYYPNKTINSHIANFNLNFPKTQNTIINQDIYLYSDHYDQYYVFNKNNKNNYVRIGSKSSNTIKNKSSLGIDNVLDYETQLTPEYNFLDRSPKLDQIDLYPDKLIEFNGSMGDYFWDLFYHLPILLAKKYREAGQFDEAEYWLRKVFDPSQQIESAPGNGRNNKAYWNCRPLKELLEQPVSFAITDPDQIARENPLFYQLAVFRYYYEYLMASGDAQYRNPTRESLRRAKMFYVTAKHLLGDRPELPAGDNWVVKELGNTNDSDFKTPTFEEVLAWWDQVEARLYNLRHNLTIDGKPMHLPFLQPAINPKQLQQAALSGASGNSLSALQQAMIPHLRFPAMLEKTRSYLGTLTDLGRSLQSTLEREDGETLSLKQQQNQIALIQLTQAIQQDQIAMEQQSLDALKASKAAADDRYNHYNRLQQDNISSKEQEAMGMEAYSIALRTAASVSYTVGQALRTAPNIFGLADGGSDWGAIATGVGQVSDIAAGCTSISASILNTQEQYRRRQVDWQFMRDQAEKDRDNIDAQIAASQLRIQQAEKQLQQQAKQLEQEQGIERFMQEKFTGVKLYQWLKSRLMNLYYQAFDAAQSLCLQTQAACQYELCDFNLSMINTSTAYDSQYKGLLAGESLMVDLQRLEKAYLERNERRQEVVKTVSLKGLDNQKATGALAQLKTTGTCQFSLKEALFDQDYPDHYQRQIKAVTISVPAVLGPYQDLAATLTQSGNTLYLDKAKNDSNAMPNKRAYQQVALSQGINESGLFQLDFNDPRYLPFEGTGVESDWVLDFPGISKALADGQTPTPEQQSLLESISDVIVQVRYTAKS